MGKKRSYDHKPKANSNKKANTGTTTTSFNVHHLPSLSVPQTLHKQSLSIPPITHVNANFEFLQPVRKTAPLLLLNKTPLSISSPAPPLSH